MKRCLRTVAARLHLISPWLSVGTNQPLHFKSVDSPGRSCNLQPGLVQKQQRRPSARRKKKKNLRLLHIAGAESLGISQLVAHFSLR